MSAARSALLFRLVACLTVAVIVAGTAFLCAWHNHRGHFGLWVGPSYTLSSLDSFRAALDHHRRESGHLPARLEDLRWPPAEPGQPGRPVEPGEVVDPWGHPYRYRVEGDAYTLCSLGRDGRPGGAGLDADLYGWGRRDARPTLWQFAFDTPTGGIWLTCGPAGACTFILGFRQGLGRPGSRLPLLKTGLTAAACVVTALVMSVLHLPTGH